MNRAMLMFLMAVWVGCGGENPVPRSPPEPDYEVFVSSVQPILIEGCANPSGCHGTARRPFSLYAPGIRRKDPERTFVGTALTPEERRANYDRARSFGIDQGAGPRLLTKPLAGEAGGVEHREGGDIYFSRRDRDYRTLEEWLEEADGEGAR